MKNHALRNISLVILAAISLAGCKTVFQNFTPERIPQNPSGIYTFSFVAELPTINWVRGSEQATITINGESYDMDKVPDSDMSFTFDYKMPPSVNEARYFYTLTYNYQNMGKMKTAVKYSTVENGKVFQSRLINRYAIQLVSDRGPAGSGVALVGNGFTQQDQIVVGGVSAGTEIFSPNSLEFIVPALPAGQTYEVVLQTGSGDLTVGNFRVDEASLSVQPAELIIDSGQVEFLIFEIENEAPPSGLYVDVRTDVPASVLMPEVIIPGGARSVNVNVEGGEPGSGKLVIAVPGYQEVTVPVTVR